MISSCPSAAFLKSASKKFILQFQPSHVMKNLSKYLSMHPTLHYLRVASFALLVNLLLSCEGPFADLSAKRGNQEENSSKSKHKWCSGPQPAQRWVTGLQIGSGSTIDPGGVLFIEGVVCPPFGNSHSAN